MLISLYQALALHLAALQLPLFQEGCIPQGQCFPYLSMTLDVPPAPDIPGTLSLTVWCAGSAAHQQRLALAEQLLEALPARGVRLEIPQGCAVVHAGSRAAQCVGDAGCLGARLTWKLSFFPAE